MAARRAQTPPATRAAVYHSRRPWRTAPGAPLASQIKTVDSLARASIKTINGLTLANIKTRNGLA